MLALIAFIALPGESSFRVFDNMFYRGMPNSADAGMTRVDILYSAVIWPKGADKEALPDKGEFQRKVRAASKSSGPFVLDVETLPLKGEAAERHFKILSTLADWTHEALRGKPIGFYGYNTLSNIPKVQVELAKRLADRIDVFFPSMYTFNDDREAWEAKMKKEADEDRALGPGKPVYFYLWPQYHDKTPKEFQYIPADEWRFELDTSRKYGDGIVIWSSSKFSWDDSNGWWEQTLDFVKQLRSAN
ncbi:MAG TPA: hypothetical protein VKT78_14690 [Fimbriimonadaceae bacterium]|nr:hypothetical protein [Fimbriimonadaceae bacterium]